MTTEQAGIKGHGVVTVIGPDGLVKDEARFRNLVTQVGDEYYGARAAGVAGAPDQVTAMKLGTGTTAPAKTGAGAALGTYLADSQQAMDSGFPDSNLVSGSRRIQWKVTYAAGKATGSAISEVVLVNDAIADATSPEGNTIARALFDTAVEKASGDTLVVTWNHDLLGA